MSMLEQTTAENTVGADKDALLAALRARLPDDAVLWEEEDLRPYECDGLSAYRRLPWVVVLLACVEQVQAVKRLCHRHKVPVVARGAGTGLSGGALPHEHGVVLSLAKFKSVLAIDVDNRTARVQPGVRNHAISQAVAPQGLYYAPDPSSQIACTIGGNVAENSGGVHCLKYGLTVHNVLRERMVTSEGEVVDLGGEGLAAPGLDLLAVFIGSEGMLGIVTEVTVRPIPKPQQARVVMASFDDVAKGGSAVANVIAAGIIPAGLVMMGRASSRMVEPFVKAGYDIDAATNQLSESDGMPDEVEEEIAHME